MLTTKLEAILFAIAKPIAITQLSKQLNVSNEVVHEAITVIKEKFNTSNSGIRLFELDGKVQFVSNPDFGDDVSAFLKKEASGPLTRPSLETLAVIAYRGPVTKPEIEQIRGVNCAIILRNLLIRGLVEEKEDTTRLQNVYTVSMDFLRELGLHNLNELSQFVDFHENEKIQQLLSEIENEPSSDVV
ncbi:SMC-Scp complex subunit ScpB [Candidatus Uhrbacteria bacterium]|nr:SMC-Scp complex subunit ScpB [Candidatus Uhrbacteria bacterium]